MAFVFFLPYLVLHCLSSVCLNVEFSIDLKRRSICSSIFWQSIRNRTRHLVPFRICWRNLCPIRLSCTHCQSIWVDSFCVIFVGQADHRFVDWLCSSTFDPFTLIARLSNFRRSSVGQSVVSNADFELNSTFNPFQVRFIDSSIDPHWSFFFSSCSEANTHTHTFASRSLWGQDYRPSRLHLIAFFRLMYQLQLFSCFEKCFKPIATVGCIFIFATLIVINF